jgi:hypothetical protein
VSRAADPGGFKGMGEGGAIGAPAAVINAVADALAPFGATITTQPLTPPFVLGLITDARLNDARLNDARLTDARPKDDRRPVQI